MSSSLEPGEIDEDILQILLGEDARSGFSIDEEWEFVEKEPFNAESDEAKPTYKDAFEAKPTCKDAFTQSSPDKPGSVHKSFPIQHKDTFTQSSPDKPGSVNKSFPMPHKDTSTLPSKPGSIHKSFPMPHNSASSIHSSFNKPRSIHKSFPIRCERPVKCFKLVFASTDEGYTFTDGVRWHTSGFVSPEHWFEDLYDAFRYLTYDSCYLPKDHQQCIILVYVPDKVSFRRINDTIQWYRDYFTCTVSVREVNVKSFYGRYHRDIASAVLKRL